MKTADAVIAGGGLHGLCAAIHLAQAGLRVVLLEQDRIGRHASSANAGGVRRLGRALPEIPLAVAALERWHNIEELIGDTCGFAQSAQIKVAVDDAGLEALKARSETVRGLGFEHEVIVDRARVREMIPAVTEQCVGGMLVDGDGHADPFQTVRAFFRKAVSLGVEVQENSPVSEVRKLGETWQVDCPSGRFEAPVFVNAAGAWGGQIASMMGDHGPVQPQALMLMITERMRPFLSAVVGAQGRTLSFKQFDNGTVLIGGGHQGEADLVSGLTRVDVRKLAVNAEAATTIFPLMKGARVTRSWAGIEGVMPDHLPAIGAGCESGGFHLFGFSAHGFALSPIGGKIIADLVVSGETDLPIAAFDIGRFRA